MLLCKINPKKGFLITTLISVPWYILELLKEGKPFWDNFFGYHNFQRYTSVVNNNAEPFWFFLYIMILASLPFTPFLYHGIFKTFKDFYKSSKENCNVTETLYTYSLCWLISVLIFFSLSATKLPSYWLPAIPAAAILISNSFINLKISNKNYLYLGIFNILIFFNKNLLISLFPFLPIILRCFLFSFFLELRKMCLPPQTFKILFLIKSLVNFLNSGVFGEKY